jgi:putative SOS response-associated peptidase YedK
MCNLYRVRAIADEVAALFGATLTPGVVWQDAIYPRYDAPVIIAHDGERRMGLMRWGFPTQVAGARGGMITKHVTNARNLASPFWRPSVMKPTRRCLVPFTQFAEPKPGKDADGRPAQYWFHLPDRAVGCFAGLWRPGDREKGEAPFFAFATCAPNPLVAPLHPKAMPVILLPEDEERWLHGSEADVLALQAPYPSQLMAVE